MYESIHVRLSKAQYEWLRTYCFENRVAQAEVVRNALELFKQSKEDTEMKMRTIRVVVIEAGVDYMEQLEKFELAVPVSEDEAVQAAIEAVAAKGYTVIPNDEGGQNEFCTVTDGDDYIAITVAPNSWARAMCGEEFEKNI